MGNQVVNPAERFFAKPAANIGDSGKRLHQIKGSPGTALQHGGLWMVRNIVIVVILGILGFLGYKAYQQRTQKAQLYNGDFTCQGCLSPEAQARFNKENSGDSPDGESEHKAAPVRVTAETAAPSQPPSTSSTMTEPAPVAQTPVIVPTTSQPGAEPNGFPPTTVNSAPIADTVAPNPTNGMTFTGKGAYQWYRQGNLTWRVDTTSGRSCIIYATMEEWRKQIVMSHGCGRNA